MEKRYFHRDGHVVLVLLSAAVVRGRDGTPLHFVAQMQDITARVVRSWIWPATAVSWPT